ncbi:MAG: YgiQ family radical SAM protein [Firmicutes bacterium HGW-Firmicutes-21]|nr:MAG: YgiQ family radical SAM protein [Firmicutes bacterium HGW-Firmicutes-21]
MAFLPITTEGLAEQGRNTVDFVIVTGDAYVDHPSFGTAIIGRVLEAEGYSVAIIPQPEWKDTRDFKRFGKPRLAFLVNSGNIDSLVAHYTAAKKKRSNDFYTPGGKAGRRPDRAVIVYCNRIREAYGDVPVIIGGIEASTRRFAHYDYWSDSVRRSILIDSRADLLTYGMGENIIRRIAFLLDKGVPINKIRDVRGTCFIEDEFFKPHFEHEHCGDYDIIKNDKTAYAKAFLVQYSNQDHIYGRAITESYGDQLLVQNPPMPPLTRKELDAVYSLPFERNYHPSYEEKGGVPAIEEVRFSITHNRGCFGNCNFCSLSFHQGRSVTSRSIESVVREAQLITELSDFKGYIHDIGGPTANFRLPACEKQKKYGTCKGKSCLFPEICKNMKVDHTEYVELLKQVEKLDKVKRVFIRSGIRFDYLIADKNEQFFKKLVRDHVSGQLKVAPEHCSDGVLTLMGKPSVNEYNKFKNRFYELTKSINKEQYIVPYLMSSHPGSTLNDAVELAIYLKKNKINPEQVQDFYPTPGTASTCMFYTGINPFTGETVYSAKSYEDKQLQRALLQFSRRENAQTVRKALIKAGREDLIGLGKDCLVSPYNGGKRTYSKSGKNTKK